MKAAVKDKLQYNGYTYSEKNKTCQISPLDEGTLTIVWGRIGTGKTDWTWLLDKRAADLGKTVITNKRMTPEGEFDYKRIATDIHYYNHFLEERKDLLLGLDESNLWQSSKNAMGKQEKNLERFLSIVRHFRTGVYFIIQRKSNFLPYLREQSHFKMWKTAKKDIKVQDPEGREFLYYNVISAKEAGVNFSTYAISSFEFKIDNKKLLQELAKEEYYKDQISKLEEIRGRDWEGYRIK